MPARRPQKGPVTGPANGARAGRSPHYLRQWGPRGAGRAAFLATNPSAWYDARDLLSTSQTTLPNRVGSGTATLTNGVVALPGSGYVYLPGTASNNLSVTKGAWGGTLHVTATLVDNTTATYTTTADPVLIGNTLLAAGSYKRFDIRENDANGAIHTTINLQTETLGHSSWTCSTGQTVTVNRSTSGLATAIVTRPMMTLDGSNDYVQLSASDAPTFTATTGTFTACVVHLSPNNSGNHVLWSSESASDRGALIFLDPAGSVLCRVGGTTTTVTPSISGADDNTIRMAALQFSGGVVRAYSNTHGMTAGTSTTGVGTIAHGTPRLGSRASATSTLYRGPILATAMFPTALSLADLDRVYSYLSGNYA